MATEQPKLSSLARSKLHHSVGGGGGGKDKYSLHRWVLLKNSIISTLPLTSTSLTQSEPALAHDTQGELEDDADEFMFPDAEHFVEKAEDDVSESEAQWLDSLLETLGDDEEGDFGGSSLQQDDDEDPLLSPSLSPMSSSDDLTSPLYYNNSSTISHPYSVPFHPPLVHSYSHDSFHNSFFTPSEHPFPYYDEDDVADLPVPDSIEDTSDDESDTLMTPSLGHSDSSFNSIEPAASAERSFGRLVPHIFINIPDSVYHPHPEDLHFPYSLHHPQEC